MGRLTNWAHVWDATKLTGIEMSRCEVDVKKWEVLLQLYPEMSAGKGHWLKTKPH